MRNVWEEVFEWVGGREFEGEWGKEEFVEQMDLYEVETSRGIVGYFGVEKKT